MSIRFDTVAELLPLGGESIRIYVDRMPTMGDSLVTTLKLNIGEDTQLHLNTDQARELGNLLICFADTEMILP